MINKNYERKLYLILFPAAIIIIGWAFIWDKNLMDFSSWLYIVPKVIAIEALSIWFFQTFLWKRRIFRNLFSLFPDLGGTWIVEVESDYIDPITKKNLEPIICMSVIVHKFNKIKFKIITNESESISFSEQLFFDKDSNSKRITYSYTNDPKLLLDYRSSSHKGTTVMKLVGEDRMEGYYFTSRGTKGQIVFKRYCKNKLDELPKDLKEI